MAVLGFSRFIAPAMGLAVGIALIRGLTSRGLGNFYIDLTRVIALPLPAYYYSAE